MWRQSPNRSWGVVASLLLVPTIVSGQAASPDAALGEALAAIQAGDMAQGRTLLESTVEQWPRFRRAHYHLGRLAFDRGDLDAASRYLDFASEGKFPKAFSAQYYLGRTLILQRRFGEAVEVLNGALELAPGLATALLARGRARLFLGEPEAGLADLLQTLNLSEPLPQALILAAQFLTLQGRTAEARPLLVELSDSNGREDWWRRRARWTQLAVDQGPGSRQELARSVGEHPEAGDLYWAMGMACFREESQCASTLFRTALDHDSENPISLLALASTLVEGESADQPAALPNLRAMLVRSQGLWEEERFDEAREIAERLLAGRPRLVPSRLLLARDAVRRGDLWQAAQVYEELLDGLGSVPSIGRHLAEVAQTMGAPELAICGVEVALQGAPSDASLYYLLGVAEADRGDSEAGIRAHETALELDSEDVRSWLRLAELYFEQMRISESIAAYERAMALDPAAAEDVRPFALSSLTTEQYASLRPVLEVHVEKHPEDIDTLYSLGVMSLRENRLEQARKYFDRLALVAPDHRQVHYNLGQIHLRQGDAAAGEIEMKRFSEIKSAEDEEWERHNQTHFRRVEAREFTEAGRPELAIPLYVQSIDEGAAELSDYEELAAASLAAGRVTEAWEGYLGILSTYPYNRRALEGLSRASGLMDDDDTVEMIGDKLRVLDWPCMMNLSQKRGDP